MKKFFKQWLNARLNHLYTRARKYNKILQATLLFTLAVCALVFMVRVGKLFELKDQNINWSWSTDSQYDVEFPRRFMWGVTLHSTRNDCYSTNETLLDVSVVKNALGIGSIKILIEWDKVEPVRNQYDSNWVLVYKKLVRDMVSNNIEPIVVLNNNIFPEWFTESGGWSNEDNTNQFIKFARTCFIEFEHVKYWLTFDQMNNQIARKVAGIANGESLHNLSPEIESVRDLVDVHVRIYQLLKSLPRDEAARIGFSVQIDLYDPYTPNSMLDKMVSSYASAISYQFLLDIISTGKTRVYVPFILDFSYENTKLQKSMDFIGISYNTRRIVKFSSLSYQIVTDFESRIYSDTGSEIYAEGLYRAARLTSMSYPHTDIIITSNKINDKREKYRRTFYERHIYALSKSIEFGHKVRGYITGYVYPEFCSVYSTASDIFESKSKVLKQSSLYFSQTVKAWTQS